jgi:hypothetical protein
MQSSRRKRRKRFRSPDRGSGRPRTTSRCRQDRSPGRRDGHATGPGAGARLRLCARPVQREAPMQTAEEIMQADIAEKPAVTAAQRRLLESRYDLTPRLDPATKMSTSRAGTDQDLHAARDQGQPAVHARRPVPDAGGHRRVLQLGARDQAEQGGEGRPGGVHAAALRLRRPAVTNQQIKFPQRRGFKWTLRSAAVNFCPFE